MAGNRRRKQENSGVRTFLYVVVVLVLLGGMGYLFYYSRSQAKERQEYIRELESKEAATKDLVKVTQPEEPESETQTETETEVETATEIETKAESESESESESELPSETESETQTESESKIESESVSESESKTQLEAESKSETKTQATKIMILNGTGKSGVAAYWRRLLKARGLDAVVMADYKGKVENHTVVYLTNGGEAPEGVYQLFSDAEYQTGSLLDVDPDADTNVKVAAGQTEYDSYDVWIVVGKDDALHD